MTLRQYEEEIKMPYVTSLEHMGIQQGILQTLQEDVIEILDVRFENVPNAIVRIVTDIDDLSILKMLHKKAAAVISMEAFESILNESQEHYYPATTIGPNLSMERPATRTIAFGFLMGKNIFPYHFE
jgi:hypothetical protein